jgi:hypothetical protein
MVGDALWADLTADAAGFRGDVTAFGASIGIFKPGILVSMSVEAGATVVRSPVKERGRGAGVVCVAGEACGRDAGQNMLPKRTRVQPPMRTTKKRTGRPLTVRLMRTF